MDMELGKGSDALARCRVLYIGTALPTESAEGSDAVQKPLRERYVGDGKLEGIDSRLIVYNDGIQLQFIDDLKTVIWFPIMSLHVCAAVKCVNILNAATGDQGSKFIPIDNITSDLNEVSPPIFAMITRRVRGIKILECHGFVCKSDQAAMALVQCCTHAYELKEEEAKRTGKDLLTTPLAEQGEDGYKSWVTASMFKQVPTTPGGYYIGEGESLVKTYGVWTSATKLNQPTKPRTLGPSSINRGVGNYLPSSEAARGGNAPKGTRIAYVPASSIRPSNRGRGIGTIDINTYNRFVRQQSVPRSQVDQDDTRSFYMYPQDKPRLSYWQSQAPTPKSPVAPSPDYERSPNVFRYSTGAMVGQPSNRASDAAAATGPSGEASPTSRENPPAPVNENGVALPSTSQADKSGSPPQARKENEKPSWNRSMCHQDGRPMTPPPDYDVGGHFDGYWHTYKEQYSKPKLDELMKKRASQALDDRVQEEFIFLDKQPEPKGPSRWSTGSKVFTNEVAFSRSILNEMESKKQRNVTSSAYDLVTDGPPNEKPFKNLDFTLGYLP